MTTRAVLTLLLASVLAARADWVTLFNGKDFTNFGAPGETEQSGYVVKDGVIESTPQCRVLMTEKQYADYILEFEFQLTPGANNGLGIHYPGSGNPAYAGMELQILDNTAEKYAGKLKDHQYHGSLYELQPALRGHLKPVGEWNSQRVTCRGPRVTVELNGICITDADLDALNKAKPGHEGAKRRSGHICFAGHGDVIRVRNMRIAELSHGGDQSEGWYQPSGKPDEKLAGMGFQPLFDGKTLDGFVKNEKDVGHWVPKDGWILHYDGKSGDLWTEKEYADFALVCDWRWVDHSGKKNQPVLLPNGLQKIGGDGKPVTKEIDEYDSGIFLRGEGRTQVNLWNWPIGSGEVYGIRTDAQQPLPIRAALTPRVPADNPVGEWNRFVITVKGERLTVVLNGKVVLHAAHLPGVKPRGKLALQNHGNALEFANLYIKEM